MSYQVPPPAINSLSASGAINCSVGDSMNRYLPPPTSNVATNGLTHAPPTIAPIKQQYLSQPSQRQHTNGLGPDSSNNSSRTASPSFNQPLNSAHLPPSAPMPSTVAQQMPRPNAYGAPLRQVPPSQPQHQTVERITNNLQHMHLNNGNGSAGPPIATTNKLLNGNVTSLQPNHLPPQLPKFNGPQVPNSQPLIQTAVPPMPLPMNAAMPANQYHLQQQQQYQFKTQPIPPNPTNLPAFNNGPNQPSYPPMTNTNNNQSVPLMPPPQTGTVAGGSIVGNRQRRPELDTRSSGSAYYPQTTQPVVSSQPPLTPQQQMQQQQPQQQQPYQQQQQYQQYATNQQYQQPSVVQQSFSSLWGHNTVDLMQQRHILPTLPIEPPKISLDHEFYESVNCSSE